MKQLAILIFAMFWLCTTAQAEIIVAPSLEWLADHCIDSGIYVVTKVKEEDGKNRVKLHMTLKRGLRGTPLARPTSAAALQIHHQLFGVAGAGKKFVFRSIRTGRVPAWSERVPTRIEGCGDWNAIRSARAFAVRLARLAARTYQHTCH